MTTTMSISEAREKLGTLAGLPVTSIEAAKILAALGITVAPEKPEPGWYFTEAGEVAQVKPNKHTGALMLYLDGEVFLPNQNWPDLTPARVVPEAEWKRVNDDRDVCAEERDQWKAKAEVAEARVRELRAELAGANETLTELKPAKPPVLTEDEVGELWDMQRTLYLSSWDKQPPVHRRIITATVNAALREHGGARELPERDEVRTGVDSACSDLFFSDQFKEMLTTRLTAALLGGGDRGE